jgi:bifunctional DNase/RNase
LRNDTFFAAINLVQNGRSMAIDARPSDAIALALRFGAPIFVDERVATEANRPELLERLKKSDAEAEAAAAANEGSAAEAGQSSAENAEARQIIEQLESGVLPKWKA